METSQSQAARRRHPRGMYTSRVDDKGRMKLPEDLRRYLLDIGAKELFITSLDGRVARLYPFDVWAEAEAMLEQPGPNATRGQQLLFQAQRYGGDAEIDNQGRVLIPAALRRAMKIENQPVQMAYFRGHIEVFSDAVFEEMTQTADDNNPDKVATFVEMGLP